MTYLPSHICLLSFYLALKSQKIDLTSFCGIMQGTQCLIFDQFTGEVRVQLVSGTWKLVCFLHVFELILVSKGNI